jgi:oxygen-independent coproporphyrinogen-3 oxidase
MSLGSSLPPLALYVHFPWCVRKCPYCDFNSHSLRDALPEAAYIEALRTDLVAQLAQLAQDATPRREIGSIFFGGGTPSLFSPASLAGLLDALRIELPIAASAEITLEANPGTIERGRFTDYRAAGINRISLGAQSFDDESLRRLGRIHAASDTRRAVEELRAAGIENFNLDLMYALPGQSVAGAVADIEQALRLEPAHISHYQLTLEPGTLFGARPPDGLPDPDQAAQMQLACQQRLAAASYGQYEVSAYAREGRRCRHNLNYWRFGDYLGIGAGAHGKSSAIEGAALRIERSWREREPRRYLSSASAAPPRRTVPAADLPFEFLMNTLRLTEGFDELDFEQRTGLPIEALAAALLRLRQRGLLESRGAHWRASALGFSFLNDLLTEFLPEPAAAPAAFVGIC